MINWQPSAEISALRQREEIIRRIRYFFQERGYLEVETPIMAQHGVTDVYLSNIKAIFRNKTYFLQTSPEYHMKRLLAAGSGPIFQFARVFRDDELGRWHNPEFTLLEWYDLNIDHHGLMTEVEALLSLVLGTDALLKMSYRDLFKEYCRIDPFDISIAALQEYLKCQELDNILSKEERDIDQYLFLILTHIIEPAIKELKAPLAIYDFPSSQASLSQVKNGAASRFEIYYQGIELANGFHELTDAAAQQQRFEEDNQQRTNLHMEMMLPDPYLLKALEHGLPHCSGVALGIDRLITLAMHQDSIAKVLAFDVDRA